MYFVIKHSSGSKQYQMTDAYNKPYISVKNVGLLPLTTNTTNGTYLKVTKSDSNGTVTYRPLEYNSKETTCYSSAENSAGLSSTTALTRSSTSGTSYLTRSSTSSTVYGTMYSVTENGISRTSSWKYYYTHTQNYATSSQSGLYIQYFPYASVTSFSHNGSYANYSITNRVAGSTYSTRDNTYFNSGAQIASTIMGVYYLSRTGTPAITTYATNTHVNYYNCTRVYYLSSYSSRPYYSSRVNKYISETMVITQYSKVVTTGTTYYTCSSTSATSYLTCSSTSGYSGVSTSATYVWE